jgi:hypothetical protein
LGIKGLITLEVTHLRHLSVLSAVLQVVVMLLVVVLAVAEVIAVMYLHLILVLVVMVAVAHTKVPLVQVTGRLLLEEELTTVVEVVAVAAVKATVAEAEPSVLVEQAVLMLNIMKDYMEELT